MDGQQVMLKQCLDTTESWDQFKLKTKQKKNPRGNCVGTLKQWDKKYVCHVAKSERQTETER